MIIYNGKIKISELFELLDVRRVRTSHYHRECDGLTERLNRT